MSNYSDFWKMVYHGVGSFAGFIDAPDNKVAVTYNLIKELEYPYTKTIEPRNDNISTRLKYIEADAAKKGLATLRYDTLSILYIGTQTSIDKLIIAEKKAK